MMSANQIVVLRFISGVQSEGAARDSPVTHLHQALYMTGNQKPQETKRFCSGLRKTDFMHIFIALLAISKCTVSRKVFLKY